MRDALSLVQRDGQAIQLVGFDGDDILWKSEDYYRSRYLADVLPEAVAWQQR